jgi:hypothetical protein
MSKIAKSYFFRKKFGKRKKRFFFFVERDFSILFEGASSNGEASFKTSRDFICGKTLTYASLESMYRIPCLQNITLHLKQLRRMLPLFHLTFAKKHPQC